jgi:hypothetical protein
MELTLHLQGTNGIGREIHEYLDQYYDELGPEHRVVFHHKKGIEHIVAKFGGNARDIAEKHLKQDHYGTYRPIPEDWSDNEFRRNLPEDCIEKYNKAIEIAKKIMED